jgi:hypothetical protein
MYFFSIIICVYNPVQKSFNRLLTSILQFEKDNPSHEVIIVDNNSFPFLVELDYVQSFLQIKNNSKIIREEKEGLTAARIAGIKESNSNWILFFDDDNEPYRDYLKNAEDIILEYSEIGAFGPGIVNVQFPSKKYENKFQKINYIFQNRQENKPMFSNDKWWKDWYPAGTGLLVNHGIAQRYSQHVLNGDYSLSDRQGKMLTSGGDLQIVLTAIKMGFKAGVHPSLKLNHIITAEKLNLKYLKNLSFGTAASNVPGHLQVWESNEFGNFCPPEPSQILRQIYFHLKVKFKQEGLLRMQLSMCSYLGSLKALYDLNPSIRPSVWWLYSCRILQVK